MVDTEYLTRLYKQWSKLDKSAKTIAHASFTEYEAKSETEMLHELVRELANGFTTDERQGDFINFLEELYMASS